MISPSSQIKLYGLQEELLTFVELYKKRKFPNKILLSGQKGIGKSTLAYHLINFILSENEEFSYDIKNFSINEKNKSYKLVQNKTNIINFTLIDISDGKKAFDISQIRNLILNLSKSSFNNKPRFVLIDNIELLNNNSTNSLLKILEEPGENIYFILINNNKKILKTLKSRCLNFNISLSHFRSIEVCNNLIGSNIHSIVNKDLLSYYITPGKILNLIKFSKENQINLSNYTLEEFFKLLHK